MIDHLACDGLLLDLRQILRDMKNREAARRGVARVFHQVAPAMEKKTLELLRTQLNTPALFVSPAGMLYWGSALQQFVYMLTAAKSVQPGVRSSTCVHPTCA